MNWTDKQLEAIYHENENILVSAGAGSGKTAILSERVLRKLKDGVNINELLILTFTKAASEEMKNRIRDKIIKNNLNEQLNLLDSSYITTFDSFALSIVKKYHYLLNLDKNINLIEESILKIQKSKIIEDVLNEEYHKKSSDFLFLVENLLKKDDNNLKEGIELILDKIELEIDTNEYLDKVKSLKSEDKYSLAFDTYYSKLVNIVEEICIRLDNMESLIETEKDEDYVSKCNTYYSTLISSETYDQIKSFFENKDRLNLPNKGITEEIMILKKEITQLTNELKDFCIYPSQSFIKENYLKSERIANTLMNIVEEIYKRFTKFKYENQMFSFIDIAKLAIKIFKEYPIVSEEIKHSLKEIMIDEYQDTSNMQEVFMSYISNNNMYMVGDIKQSIYRFRYANPNLFKDKYTNYKKHIGGYLIDLNTNFRSRKEVLSNINEIFSQIMQEDIGGANYKKDHLIEYGNKAFLDDNIQNQDNNLIIYNYNKKEFFGLTNSEIEAFIVANDIKNKLDNKYLVFDKDNKNRLATYKDFTVLVDKRSDFATYKKIFEYFNLPVTLFQNENIVGNDDLYCFNSILILISGYNANRYDVTFKHAYYSVGKSYLFSLSDQEILEDIVNCDFKSSIIYQKLEDIISNLNILSLKDLFKKIIFDLDWYNMLPLKGDVVSSEARVAYLLNLSSNLDLLDYTLDEVIKYFKTIMEKELEIVLPGNNGNENTIKFMTIHNSKGLEFPLCYFIGFSNQFNTSETRENFIVTDTGLILPFIDDNLKYHNIDWFKYKQSYINEEIGEKIRLLYVALTRTKEKMIMAIDLFNSKSKEINKSNKFLDFISGIYEVILKYTHNVDKKELTINPDYKKYVPNKNIKNDYYEYLYTEIENNIDKINIERYSKDLNLDDSQKQIIEKGNHLHNLLFELDFKNPDFSKMSDEDRRIIELFLDNPYFAISKAINIYKEVEFKHENRHGFMDLVIEYEHEYKIIDYKLSNIDNHSYIKQLQGYRDYLSRIIDKPIKLCLYSLNKGEYKIID